MPDKVRIIIVRHGNVFAFSCSRRTQTVRKIDKIYYITPKIRKKAPFAYAIIVAGG